MAATVVRKLIPFAVAAGVDPAALPDGPADLSRFVHLKKARRMQTGTRYRRRGSRGAHGGRGSGRVGV